MPTLLQLALIDSSTGSRTGTLEIADYTTISSISYGKQGSPQETNRLTIHLVGSFREHTVVPVGMSADQFLTNWRAAVGASSQPPAVTGSRNLNVALENLLIALDTLGVVDDQTTAQ